MFAGWRHRARGALGCAPGGCQEPTRSRIPARYPNLGYLSSPAIFVVMSKRNSASQQARLQSLLRDTRMALGMRQADLARRLGQPQSFVSKYETGERRIDVLELRVICQAMGLSLTEFASRLEDALR